MQYNYKIKIDSEIHIHMAIYKVTKMMESLGADKISVVKLKTIISELGQNVLKYAGTGYLSLFQIERPKLGVRVLAEDKGQGIKNIEEALKDHFSTSGSLGLGLPAVKRMADAFKIESSIEKGTVIDITVFI